MNTDIQYRSQERQNKHGIKIESFGLSISGHFSKQHVPYLTMTTSTILLVCILHMYIACKHYVYFVFY